MTFEQFANHIKENIQARFHMERPNVIQTEMLDLTPQGIANKEVFRFCRPISSNVSNQFWKTLLVTGIDPDQIRDVLQWAALCKELLLDPETSDVYLFIIWSGENNPSIEECLRIEANEDFCRKFVLKN